MIDINVPIAFGAGVVSFLAPCVIPLLPAYISYVTGVSLKELKEKGQKTYKRKLLISSLFYIFGFSLVFVILGTAAAGFGTALRRHGLLIQRFGGLIIIILGLEFAGIFHIPFLAKTKAFSLPKWVSKLGNLRAFFIGLVFAVTWTPCVGAVLGSILTLAAISRTVIQGSFLLFIYSLGISIPFLIVSLTLASAPKYLSFIEKKIEIISKVAGYILVLLGILLFTNTYRFINSWVFAKAFEWGYKIR